MTTGPTGGDEHDYPTIVGFKTGQFVGNRRYVLKQLLGQGGMGVVWLAHDESLNEDVALKFLPPQIRFDPTALDDLRRETLRSRKLTHPHIIRIHDLFEAKDQDPFISMEYVNGPTLSAKRLEMPGRAFQWEFLASLVRQLCEALDYAHTEGIVHRDLKPSNLMLDSRGRLKLADFGIARVVTDSMSRVSAQKETSGTLVYMSPQQVDGKPSSPTDDIYSLGATLYELVTSKPPFYTGDVAHQIRYITPDSLSQRLIAFGLASTVPPVVEETIAACLSKDPAQRPHSAREVSARLGLQETKMPTTRTVSVPAAADKAPTAVSEPDKAPASALTGAMLVVVGLITAGVAWYLVKKQAGTDPVPPAQSEVRATNAVASTPPATTTVLTSAAPVITITQAPPVIQVVTSESSGPIRGQLQATEERLRAAEDQARRIAEERDRLAQEKARLETERLAQEEAERKRRAELEALALKYPAPGTVWTNSLGMVFRPLPGTAALLAECETRYQDFEAFVTASGYSAAGSRWKNPGMPVKPGYPVTSVSWDDALRFCQWLTEQERKADRLGPAQAYRLPTDLEWSAAVGGLGNETGASPALRSGKIKRLFPWGNATTPPVTAGNYAGSEMKGFNLTREYPSIPGAKDDFPMLAPVGSFPANALGFRDLGGNVWEWCQDWFNNQQRERVLRGGAWDTTDPDQLLSSFRYDLGPGIRNANAGFRCLLDLRSEAR